MFGCRAPTDLEIPASRGLAILFLSRQQGMSMRVSSCSEALETCTYAKKSEVEVSAFERVTGG